MPHHSWSFAYLSGLTVFLGLAVLSSMACRRQTVPDPESDTKPEPDTPTKPSEVDSSVRKVLFGAEVLSAQGVETDFGEACLVEAALGHGAAVENLAIYCGEKIYEAGPGPATEEEGFVGRYEELKATEGTFRYALVYTRRGTAADSSTRIELDSSSHRAKVWKDGDDPWTVVLHVDGMSFPRRGGPLGHGRALSSVVEHRWTAKRTLVDGMPPMAWNAAPKECEVTMVPIPLVEGREDERDNCRIQVRCGGVSFYGEKGHGDSLCPREAGKLGSVVNTRSTAGNVTYELRLSPAKGEVVIAGTELAQSFAAYFELETLEPCVPRASKWVGWHPREGKPPHLEVNGGRVVFTPASGKPAELQPPETCSTGPLSPPVSERPMLVFGPGRRTLGGYTATGDPVAFRRIE